MEFTPEESAVLARILRWRRDVRHFTKAPIAEARIERLREAMEWAPSVGNARPWRVIRVEDAGLREGVRANFLAANAEAEQAYQAERRAAYRQLKLAGLDAAPLQLAIFTSADPEEGHGLGRRTMPGTLQDSTAMAIFTLWLAARAENLGLGMVSILDPGAMEQLFAVPEGWVFSAYLCIGHPEFADDTPLLHRLGWQENRAPAWETR